MNNYEFSDQEAYHLNSGIIYYRLRQNDIDDKYSYSNIVTFTINTGRPSAFPYPNPVSTTLNIRILTDQKEHLRWQLINNAGNTIKNGQQGLLPGVANIKIDLQGMAAGTYTILLESDRKRQMVKNNQVTILNFLIASG